MAWTNVGFDGTINEAQWSQMAGLLGNDYVAAGNGDCLVTAVGGARSVSVAAGSLYGDGIVSTNSAPETVAMTTPVNGQWYVIALRRTWATNTAALVAIAGATTTTTTPTAPPTSFPTLNTNKGVLTDQPIAWAWCNSANTNVVVYDIRLKAVKSLPPVVANVGERDAKFMTPSQGLQVWRDDLGAVETYFGLYNASTNPGGRDTAGWYINGRAGALVPIRPSTVTIATGTGTTTALGAVNFSGATSISLNGVFTSQFTNYRIIISGLKANTGAYPALNGYFRAGSTNATANYWAWGINVKNSTGIAQQGGSNTSAWPLGSQIGVSEYSSAVFEISSPALTKITTGNMVFGGFDSGTAVYTTNHLFLNDTNSYDGFSIAPTSSNITGTIQVFGYLN